MAPKTLFRSFPSLYQAQDDVSRSENCRRYRHRHIAILYYFIACGTLTSSVLLVRRGGKQQYSLQMSQVALPTSWVLSLVSTLNGVTERRDTGPGTPETSPDACNAPLLLAAKELSWATPLWAPIVCVVLPSPAATSLKPCKDSWTPRFSPTRKIPFSGELLLVIVEIIGCDYIKCTISSISRQKLPKVSNWSIPRLPNEWIFSLVGPG